MAVLSVEERQSSLLGGLIQPQCCITYLVLEVVLLRPYVNVSASPCTRHALHSPLICWQVVVLAELVKHAFAAPPGLRFVVEVQVCEVELALFSFLVQADCEPLLFQPLSIIKGAAEISGVLTMRKKLFWQCHLLLASFSVNATLLSAWVRHLNELNKLSQFLYL